MSIPHNVATIPIKQVKLNKNFVPLAVSYSADGKETLLQSKLYDEQRIQECIQDILNK
jgi:hypothetical protein